MAFPRWLFPTVDAGQAAQLARELGISPLAARILWNRGHRDAALARRFLRPSLDDLYDPFALAGMREAVERLLKAIRDRETVLLYGDYDVDGTTSVVVLKTAIELAGGRAAFHIPDRFGEGYGMRAEVIEQVAREGVGLVISVDTGIRAGPVAERARELGVDLIITDHHLPEESLPPALAVLNPKRPDCPYPDKDLCGVGIVFKLVQALFSSLGWTRSRAHKVTASLLKLVAIGTVADLVPLVGENRILVKHGLAGLSDVRNPGLRALLDVSGISRGVAPSAGQVAFRIAPRINAAGRMETARQVIDLFLTADPAEARALAERLHALNADRQAAEAGIVELVLEQCQQAPVTPEQAGLVFCGDRWHKGVVGIVASRLVERFHRPTFVLCADPETGEVSGSGRSIPRFHLLEALESMAGLFLKYGGHRQAAGVTMAAARLEEFRQRFQDYAAARLTPADLEAELEIDAVVDFAEVDEHSVGHLAALAPFGSGNREPVFAARGVELAANATVFKEKHVRAPFRQGGRYLNAKAWNFAERLPELAPGRLLDLAFTIEEDRYSLDRGMPGWSATLKDVRPAQ